MRAQRGIVDLLAHEDFGKDVTHLFTHLQKADGVLLGRDLLAYHGFVPCGRITAFCNK
jgi:hypothetical protein